MYLLEECPTSTPPLMKALMGAGIISRAAERLTHFPVNRGCLWYNDLIVTNYALNVKSSTFANGRG